MQQAKADAEADKRRRFGYRQYPACAQIDPRKAIPATATTSAPGAGFAITAPAG